jgi:hypothetical protein
MANLDLRSFLDELATGELFAGFANALFDLGIDQWFEEARGIECLLAFANDLR